MKKFVYLCGMMMLSLNMMAQIDLNDKNWDTVFIEDFSGIRSWDSQWKDQRDIQNYSSIWRCYMYEYWYCGATTATKEHQAYQPSNTIFGSDQTMKLIGEFHSQNNMWCGIDYDPAPPPHRCDTPSTAQHQSVHYYSGMIETINPVGFGYYEIECKMPVHVGACSAFWFWSNLGGTYNEIDVFEHAKSLTDYDINRETVSGIWYNPDGINYSPSQSNNGAHRYVSKHFVLPDAHTSLESYHTFGCLWLPEKVEFYVDDDLVNKCDNPDQIPQYPMRLKITHLEDGSAMIVTRNSATWWEGTDEMTINYVKAFQLKSDCETDATIRSITDFNNYDYSVKRSITMGAQSGILTLPSGDHITMRAVDSITIDGGFEVPIGTELTLITQDCPQWPEIDAKTWEMELLKTTTTNKNYKQ